MKNHILILFSVSLLLAVSCKNGNKPYAKQNVTIQFDSLQLETLADTIIYDVVVKNTDKSDLWTEECLKKFDKKAFVNTLFEDIYNKKVIAYDFYSSKPLTPADVKKLEKLDGYSRDIIGKFQFNESWQYDKQNMVMVKKVHSIIFGYEAYTSDSLIKGYKPLFKVHFN
jgi:hypothetical protein